MTSSFALDPALDTFLQQLQVAFDPPPHTQTAQQFRALIETLSQGHVHERPPGMVVRDELIHVARRPVRLRIYRPNRAGLLPALLYMHGGGWTVGSIDTHDSITSEMAQEIGCVVVSVDYSLAPEHPYPAALDDVDAATDWLLAQCATQRVDPARLAIGGDSAGGNLALALCLRRRDQQRANPFCQQLLLYPAVDTRLDRVSFRTNHDAPFLGTPLMKWFLEHYLQNDLGTTDPYAMPLKAASFEGVPEAVVTTAEFDPLLDEGIELAQRMVADGVRVTYRMARSLMHGYLRVRGLSRLADDEFRAICGAAKLRLHG